LTGQEVYLLVDDAEQLDESALEALLALAAGTPEGRPHVFLFGESSLIADLEQISGEQELFHVIELQPYEEEETREYLAQRLEGAGAGIELFTANQISDIHESAGGWPGTINQVARDALIEAMIASRSAVKRPKMGFTMPKKHVLAISAVVVVAVAAAWLIPGRSKAPATAGAPTEQAQLPLGKPTPNVEFANSGQPTNLPMVGQPVMRGPLAEEAGGISEGDDGVPVEGSSATPPTVTTTAPPAGVPAGQPAPVAKPTPAPTVATAKPAPVAKPVAPAPAAKPAPVAKPAEKPATVAKAASPAAAGSSWYTSQPAGHFVVQILGTSSEANAQAFVKEQGGEYRYFKKVLNGKPLYVITYGNFPSRAAADSAIKALPAKVQAGKPWPRTVASVQQELATTR
ncbi:SPOR domain-containing protein, partial [Pseudomonas tolaasii]|uniref:SPOR domain-containing protein n=1 Tax=Pseudomonas tolaasii TaxID=29442 RepID=UPI00047472D7